MDNKTLLLLVGSGAAAAIAGIYKAPIAGLVFTLEVLMVDLTMASLLPILISCVTATCFTYIFTGSDSLFTFHLDGEWLLERVPASILLGIFCGLVSLYFIRTMTACENIFGRFKNRLYVRLTLGGLILSLLIFLFPSLYGEGYSAVNILLNGQTQSDWDTMTGVMHAPLTGIFLIAELTGGYQLFMPLMIVCISAYLTINIFEPHSIYGMRLAREGKLITHHTDHAALTLMNLHSIIERDYTPVTPDLPLGKLVQAISRSHTNFIPVIDQANTLLGIIDLEQIRHIMFRTELYQKFNVSQLMRPVDALLGINDPMEDVMNKFDQTSLNYLPVVDVNNHIIGVISRTRTYKMYRKMVEDLSAE